jgi:predicted phosphoribosyltransferase
VPIGAIEALVSLRDEADELVCLAAPEPFLAVGAWYEEFAQVSDGQVMELLDEDRRRGEAAPHLDHRPLH